MIKRIPRVRVAELAGTAAGFEPESISPIIGPLFDELCRRLDLARLVPTGPAIAYYEDGPDGDVVVHAALPVQAALPVHTPLPVGAEPVGDQDFSIVDLPEIDMAATIVHRGSMDSVMPTMQTLARWIDANGYPSGGYNRELYIQGGTDRDAWVTELQEPLGVNPAGGVT